MNIDRLNETNRRLRRAVEHYESRQTQVSSSRPIAAGDLFVLNTPTPLAALWCAVLQNLRDPELWFVVPGDEFSLAGSDDVSLPPQTERETMNFRCGQGIWVHQQDLPITLRVDCLDAESVEAIRIRLAEMVDGSTSSPSLREDVDEDIDYQEWMEQVSQAVESLATTFEEIDVADAKVLLASSANQNWLKESSQNSALGALAADSLSSALEVSNGLQLDLVESGQLVALFNADEVHLQYFGQHAPELMIVKSGRPSPVTWRQFGDFFTTGKLAWVDGEITLLHGSKLVTLKNT